MPYDIKHRYPPDPYSAFFSTPVKISLFLSTLQTRAGNDQTHLMRADDDDKNEV